jgi:hypothetical protein
MRVPLPRRLSLASPTRRLKRKRQQHSSLLILCLRCASLRRGLRVPGLTPCSACSCLGSDPHVGCAL